MSLRERHINAIRKKANRGFSGYPIATIAFYGPTDKIASKVTAAIILGEEQDVAHLERWFSSGSDIRRDHHVMQHVIDFIRSHTAKSVLITENIIGCPHEEGVDYPEGATCPACPFWAGRNRWTGAIEH